MNESLWNHTQGRDQEHPQEKEMQKAKWLSEEALRIAEKKREVKGKGEKEKEMATHSSILAWRIPGIVEPRGLPSMGSHRVRHDWSDLAAAAAASKSHLTTITLGQVERCLL